jgi:hypothetical protein
MEGNYWTTRAVTASAAMAIPGNLNGPGRLGGVERRMLALTR